MPTVPFILVSAFFYSYSSEKSYNKLMNSKLAGKALRSWNETHTLNGKTKFLVVSLICLSFGGTCLFFIKSNIIRAILITIALLVSLYILSIRSYESLYKD